MASTALAYRQPLRNPRYDEKFDQSAYGRAARRQRMQAETVRRERKEQSQVIPQMQPKRQLRVIEGQGKAMASAQALVPSLRSVFAIALIVVAVIGVTFMVRVGITDATMGMLSSSEQLSQSITDERFAATQLELDYSKATSAATIQEVATSQLGMVPDEQVEYIRVVES